MASSWRSLDLDRVQLRTIFARTDKNVPIPSSLILIANGDGGTRWSSISTILEISSFRTIKGNTATTFSADMSNNVLQISTTGVRGTFLSYADPTTSSLMLSNAFPPVGITNVVGAPTSVITVATASNLPGGFYMAPEDGNSTIKFIGVNDIQFSTITSQKAAFIIISSFTAAGYSSISGELFQLKQGVPSTFSTLRGRPCFMSSMTSNAGWLLGSQTAIQGGADLYISTVVMSNVENFYNFVDTTSNTTQIHFDYYPALVLGVQSNIGLYAVSTFLQARDNSIGRIAESVVTGFITSQNASLSNVYTTPVRMRMNATSLSNIAALGANQDVWIVHRIIGGSNTYPAAYQNRQSGQNSLFITMTSSGPVY